LPAAGKKVVTEIMDLYLEQPKGRSPYASKPPQRLVIKELPLHREISAGVGTTGTQTEPTFITAAVPSDASYAIRVSGISMEPLIHDDEIIVVKVQNHLEPGEIGVFFFEGDAFCKRYEEKNGAVFLVSANERYKPIEVDEYHDLRIIGKVVLILEET
jgi:SOS-response transcriptional repressor LexA